MTRARGAFAALATCFLAVLSIGCPPFWQGPTTALFLDIVPPEAVQRTESTDVPARNRARERVALLNKAYLFSDAFKPGSGKKIRFNLFPDVNFNVLASEIVAVMPDQNVWRGSASDNSVLRVALWYAGKEIVGEVWTLRGTYSINPTGAGDWYRIVEIDKKGCPPETEPIETPASVAKDDTSGGRVTCDQPLPPVPPGKGPRIRFLVAYTPAVRHNDPKIASHVVLLIDQLSQIWSTRNFIVYPILAHVQLVDYTESGQFEVDYDRLERGEGGLGNLHGNREMYRADMVVLIVDGHGSVGGAGRLLLPGPTKNDDDKAFIVVDRLYAGNYQGLAHQLGHFFGMRGDRFSEKVNDPVGFNYGFVCLDSGFYSIMATDDECHHYYKEDCRRLPIYSSPHSRIKDCTLGSPIGQPKPAHNLEQLCWYGSIVESFRH